MQWNFQGSSRILGSPNSAVVGVDRPSEREMIFIGPQHVTQPIVIFRHLLKSPHRKYSPLLKITGQYFTDDGNADDTEFGTDTIRGYVVVLQKQ